MENNCITVEKSNFLDKLLNEQQKKRGLVSSDPDYDKKFNDMLEDCLMGFLHFKKGEITAEKLSDYTKSKHESHLK